MPRIPRTEVLFNGPYHVFCRGNEKKEVFCDSRDYLAFLAMVKKACITFDLRLYHYVLMNNHYHLLLEPMDPSRLSKAMRDINWNYSWYHRKRYGRSGHLWEGRFHSIPIEDDAYFLTCAAYIELNPVRAGIVKAPELYPWSSYKTYAMQRPHMYTSEHCIVTSLAGTSEGRAGEYKKFVQGWLGRSPTTNEEMILLQGD